MRYHHLSYLSRVGEVGCGGLSDYEQLVGDKFLNRFMTDFFT